MNPVDVGKRENPGRLSQHALGLVGWFFFRGRSGVTETFAFEEVAKQRPVAFAGRCAGQPVGPGYSGEKRRRWRICQERVTFLGPPAVQNLAGLEDVVGYVCSVKDDAAHRVRRAFIRSGHVAEYPLIDSLVHFGELFLVTVFLGLLDGAESAEEKGWHAVDPARDNDARFGDIGFWERLAVNLQVAADRRGVEQHRPDRCLRITVVGEHLKIAVGPFSWSRLLLQATKGIAAEGEIEPYIDETQNLHPGRQILDLLERALPGLAEVDVLVEAGMPVVMHRVPVANVNLPAAFHKAFGLQG